VAPQAREVRKRVSRGPEFSSSRPYRSRRRREVGEMKAMAKGNAEGWENPVVEEVKRDSVVGRARE